ncbi:MAG: hypothetical protein E8D45_07015, partial [Nitrospira sp.]
MDQHNPLNDYRRYLLGILAEHATRTSYEDTPGRCQVLVNHERVGILDCASFEPTFTFSSREQVVSQLEIRAEDGTLLGVLSAPEGGFKTAHVQIGRHDLDLTIHNRLQGGSATAMFRAASGQGGEGPELPADLRRPVVGIHPRPFFNWNRATACAQVLLVVAVLGLVADRFLESRSGRQMPAVMSAASGTPEPTVKADVNQLEERLKQLSRSQDAAQGTARMQQIELGRLRQVVSALSSTHQEMKARPVTARRTSMPLGIGKRDVQREVENMAEMLIGRADADQEQLREEIRGLALANDKLAKQLSALEAGNHELKSRLKSVGVDLSKASSVEDSRPAIAQQPKPSASGSLELAEKPREEAHNPMLFWVTFQDGTNEQKIEQLVREIHGRRGQRKAEWTSLEVDLPDPNTQAGFLESLKKTSIVKAVA